MSQPILSIEDADLKVNVSANLLPCRIEHNGNVPADSSLWMSHQEADVTTSYFRGRKLLGKEVPIPPSHRGVLVKREDHAQPQNEAEVLIEDEMAPEAGNMKVLAEFDRITVWGHETVADADKDGHTRAMEEWIGLSEKIHSLDMPNET